jgi:hypothetical protein
MGAVMSEFKFTLICPRCAKTSETVGADRWKNPRVNCGDCLMDAIEIVELKVVKVEELP